MSTTPHRPRIAVSQDALLGREGMADLACTIIDVSGEGFRLRVGGAVPCGRYTLTYSGQPHAVEIRWATISEAGGLFIAGS